MALPIVGRDAALDRLGSEPDRLATGATFSIEEVTGRKRRVEMTGWCLPVRPVTLSVQQRLRITYYPGATEASAQVLGPHHTDMTVSGILLARRMGEEGAGYFRLAEGGTVEVIKTPERARAVLADLCRSGQEVIVRWGDQGEAQSVTQRGFVRAARFQEHAPQRIEWELEFEWVADTAFKPRLEFPKPPPDEKSLWQSLQDAVAAVDAVMSDLNDAYTQYVTQTIRKLNTLIDQVGGLAQKALDLAAKPAQFARSVAATCENVLQTVLEVQQEAVLLVGQYREVADAFARLGRGSIEWMPITAGAARGAATDHSVGTQAEAAVASAAVQAALRDARYEAVRLRKEAQRFAEPAIRALHLCREGDSLRRIATRYYGTPDRWQDIADINGLPGDEVRAGEVLLIPR